MSTFTYNHFPKVRNAKNAAAHFSLPDSQSNTHTYPSNTQPVIITVPAGYTSGWSTFSFAIIVISLLNLVCQNSCLHTNTPAQTHLCISLRCTEPRLCLAGQKSPPPTSNWRGSKGGMGEWKVRCFYGYIVVRFGGLSPNVLLARTSHSLVKSLISAPIMHLITYLL